MPLADQFAILIDHRIVFHDQKTELFHHVVAVAVLVFHVPLAQLVVADDPGNAENHSGHQQDTACDEAVGDHLLSGIENEEKDGIQFVKQHGAGHDGKQHRQKRHLFHVGEKEVELEEL